MRNKLTLKHTHTHLITLSHKAQTHYFGLIKRRRSNYHKINVIDSKSNLTHLSKKEWCLIQEQSQNLKLGGAVLLLVACGYSSLQLYCLTTKFLKKKINLLLLFFFVCVHWLLGKTNFFFF